MSSYIHLVLSEAPATVSEDDYNAWYDAHVQEILSVEGWESATRYAIEGAICTDSPTTFRFLSLYELSCPPDVAVANLAAADLGHEGKLRPPDWFTAIECESWNCTQFGERLTLHPAAGSSS